MVQEKIVLCTLSQAPKPEQREDGTPNKSASDYTKGNYDLVIETIKGKPELVCKYWCIIIPLKKKKQPSTALVCYAINKMKNELLEFKAFNVF